MTRYAGQAMVVAENIADEVAREATTVALDAIDSYFNGATKRSKGPCGDALASFVHNAIQRAVFEHLMSDDAQPIL